MKSYNPQELETKWQKKWLEFGVYKNYSRNKKFYVLDMFPYPSGAGLHVGHPKGYIATDVVSRYKLLQGYSILHPMGWDAFGLPAENYAIKNKVHPRIAVEENIVTFKKQLEKFGFTYDWDREISTTHPEYYKWTQWIFLKMFEKGLAYESNESVNWCPSCKTVLANEDLEGWLCERCGTQVVQEKMCQWVLKMTAYADRLLEDLKLLDWESEIIKQQRNWIGRKEGINIRYQVDSLKEEVVCFTTRPDTNFGATFVVISPEHTFVHRILQQEIKTDKKTEVAIRDYVEKAKAKSEIERQAEGKEKSGVFTGYYAINNLNGKKMPIWISDFVLTTFGTGAVIGVPGHDLRDFQFAKKFDIEIIRVVVGKDGDTSSVAEEKQVQEEDGTMINSEFLDGLEIPEATKKIMDYMEKKNYGKRVVNYKMRDWVFSRQRYWGEPIPIVHCEKCGAVAVPENQLPVMLPEVERYEPTGTGEGPLAAIHDWVNTKCPKCGGIGKRETNTMPQWAGSSWYYLRYIDPKNKESLIDKNLEKEWMPVDLYIGGAEHATRHLLYARFWHKFLYDMGVVSTAEPFKKFMYVGLILAEDGRKMSKRWNNVINPDDIINQYGADSMRLYEMFMGPFMQAISWSMNGVQGVRRFLDRIWKLQENLIEAGERNVESLVHKTIKKVTEDIEQFRFNTAISAMMILVNEAEKNGVTRAGYESLLKILSPFAPHITEEIWDKLGYKESIFLSTWPEYDAELIKDEEINLVIQINGKVRDTIRVSADISEENAKKVAMESDRVKMYIVGREIKKIIFVAGKLINIVI